MKNKSVIFFCVLMFECFVSCNYEEDRLVYSCNPIEDEWVHDNLDEIRCMTRTQWEGLAENLKRPALAAFTPEQRVVFWTKKFENILLFDWNEVEKEHIKSVVDYITLNPEIFQGFRNLSDDKKDEFEMFFYRWKERSINELGWDKTLVSSMINSPNTLLDKNGKEATSSSVAMRITSSESSGTTKPNCNCSLKSDWCIGPGDLNECQTNDCERVSDNCGTLLVYDCDGRCGGI